MKEKLLIFKDEKLNLKATISVICSVIVLCGIVGFIYELIFYKIDLGYFVKRGSTFGPWIPIYGVGGFFVLVLTYRFKGKPWLVFILNSVLTAIIEYFTGMALYEIWGLRLWDYNVEIWSWGNINGYICFRSILCFAISSLIIIYVATPFFIKLSKKVPENKYLFVSVGLTLLFLFDSLAYNIIRICQSI